MARPRSFHQPSGRLPITFMPSTIHRTTPYGKATSARTAASIRKLLHSRHFQNNKVRLNTTRTVSISNWGHGRHGASWMAYDISLSGEVGGGAARSGGTGRWNWWKYNWTSVAPTHNPPRKLTESTPRHNTSAPTATVKAINTRSDVVVAEGLSPYCLSSNARRRRYGSAKKANLMMMCRPSTTTTTA